LLQEGREHLLLDCGENQFHAILGAGPSFIVHSSSLAVPMLADGATFSNCWSEGRTDGPASEYFTLPSKNLRTESVTGARRLLTHHILPGPGGVKSGHYEVRYKTSHDWPIAFASVLLTFNVPTVQSARIVMGG
jgi:xanthine dehydrogenase YagS FAD-binding subunit